MKTDRQHNGQMKKDKTTNNDLQNTKQKTKDRVTEAKIIPLTHGCKTAHFRGLVEAL